MTNIIWKNNVGRKLIADICAGDAFVDPATGSELFIVTKQDAQTAGDLKITQTFNLTRKVSTSWLSDYVVIPVDLDIHVTS